VTVLTRDNVPHHSPMDEAVRSLKVATRVRIPLGLQSGLDRMLAGESVKDLAAELSVDSSTLYKWRRQALIDAGRSVGLKSYESDRLAQASGRSKNSRTS